MALVIRTVERFSMGVFTVVSIKLIGGLFVGVLKNIGALATSTIVIG